MAAIDDDGAALPTNGADRSHRQGYLTIGEELRRAAEIQRYLLPPPVYTGRFVEVAGATRPCRAVGGDFFDYHDVGHEFRVVLGDVCGKGAPAALQAALVQGILAFQADADGGPAKLMAHLNRALCRRLIPNRFVTMFCAILTSENRLTYCNAGQCRPILLNGQCLQRLSTGGCPLGVFPNASYEEESMTISAGDTLVVFSDGVSEAAAVSGERNEQFGDARILEIVREVNGADGAAPAILNRLLAGLRTYTRHARQTDDVTALVVRYRAGRDPVDGTATGA
jgi:sigma-B regulation protein RsbU (phosphoserine phosphatase)